MISAVVFTTLRGFVNDRCYPSRFPQEEIGAPGTTPSVLSSPTYPAIRYTIVSGFNQPLICGTDSRDTDDTRVQVDCVAKTHGAMVTLCDQVITAMQTTTPPCVRDGYTEFFDFETKTHRGILDFIFYPSSGSGSP